MHKEKERARPYLQQHLVNMIRPDKWSHNITIIKNSFTKIFKQGKLNFVGPNYVPCNLYFLEKELDEGFLD